MAPSMTPSLSELDPNAALSKNTERGNLNIQFARASTLTEPLMSDTWHMGERSIQFAQLPPNGSIGLDQGRGRFLVKVVTGRLANPHLKAFCEPFGLQNNLVESSAIQAGPDGALLTIVTEPEDAAAVISSMNQLEFNGPLSEILQWQTFDDLVGEFTQEFRGIDGYAGPGFHLLDQSGEEITYVNIWTAGNGVDLTTHNHSMDPNPQMPAFAEVHWVICNGSGKGGMYMVDEPGGEKKRFVVAKGYEHGPFFEFNTQTGEPVMRENGTIEYPWHGWEAGGSKDTQQAYDLVFAYETAPQYANVLQ